MKIEDLQILLQLVEAMNQATIELEKNYKRRDIEKLKESKRAILDFHDKISEVIEK